MNDWMKDDKFMMDKIIFSYKIFQHCQCSLSEQRSLFPQIWFVNLLSRVTLSTASTYLKWWWHGITSLGEFVSVDSSPSGRAGTRENYVTTFGDEMMLSAVCLVLALALVLEVLVEVEGRTEDCPLHCPPTDSPVCGTGEPWLAWPGHHWPLLIFRWPELPECLQAAPVLLSPGPGRPAETCGEVWSTWALSSLLSPHWGTRVLWR